MNNDIKFFMFSTTDYQMRIEIGKKIGRPYKAREVLVNGIYIQYTEILNDPKDSRFPDAILVASGDIREMIYKK